MPKLGPPLNVPEFTRCFNQCASGCAAYETRPDDCRNYSCAWLNGWGEEDERPDKLAELQDLWWAEAERHGVLPLDDRMVELFGVRFRAHSPHPESRRYVYRPPMSPLPSQAGAAVGGRSFDLTARVTRRSGEGGVLYATGTENSGISVFVQNDRLVVDYNAFDEHSILESDIALPDGDSTLTARFRRSDGRAGAISLEIDGAAAGNIELPLYMRMISSVGGSIGYDHGSAVSSRYVSPFEFAGTLHEVVIQLVAKQDPAAEQAAARAEMSRQ